MTISEKILYLFETMSFLAFIRDRLQNTHCFLSSVWQSISEMVTYGEPILSFLPRHRELRILRYSEYHCCPATKRQDD
jgi:hypothetical protein